MGGYYPFEVAGKSWILENGAYWASEGGVELRLYRERVWTSFWAGEGFIDYQTKVSGYGRVVLNAPGPVEEVTLKDERLMVEGKLVLARTEGLAYRMRRATSLVQSLFSGEAAMRVYEGTGKALVCWTPYWNQRSEDDAALSREAVRDRREIWLMIPMQRRAFLAAIAALSLMGCTATGGGRTTDPLPSWNDGPAKQAIVEFVEPRDRGGRRRTSCRSSERIAVFDNDGTLWAEQPIYFQFAFAIDRVKALAPEHPEWKDTQPFKAVLEGDLEGARGIRREGRCSRSWPRPTPA